MRSHRYLGNVPAAVVVALSGCLLLAACGSGEHHSGAASTTDAGANGARPHRQHLPPGQVPQPGKAWKIPPVKTIPVGPPTVTETPATHIVPKSEKEKAKKLKRSGPPPHPRARKRGRGVPLGPSGVLGPASASITGGSTPTALTTAPAATSFDSTNFDDNATLTGGYLFIPPDPSAASGPNYLVDVTNVALAIHQKDGTLLLQEAIKDFFSGATPAPTTDTFDPKVIYDQYAQRFLVVALEQTDTAAGDASNTSHIFLAVSQTSDPTGSWYVTAINSVVNISGTDYWADYPGFAVGKDAVYVTTNMFAFGGASGYGVRLWMIDKGLGSGGFYDGGAPTVSVLDPYGGGGIASTTQPTQMFGTPPTGTGTYLVSYDGINDGTNSYIQVIRLDNPLTSPTFTQQYVNIGSIDDLTSGVPNAPQWNSAGDSPPNVDTNDRRALDSVWRDGELWMTTTIVPTSSTDAADAGQATAHWVEMATCVPGVSCTTVPVASLTDQGNIGGEDIAAGTYTFMPSIAVNAANDAVINFAASGPSIHPGAYFAERHQGDSPGTFGPSQTLRVGVDEYNRTFGVTPDGNRWGDYSGAAVDPSNECLWVFNEYALTRGTTISGEDGRWVTAYAPVCECAAPLQANQWKQFSLSCSPGTANTVADVMGNDLGVSNYNITWVVWGRDATTDSYYKLALTDPMVVGQSYWVLTTDSGRYVGVSGTLSSNPVDIPLVGDASGRFNMVGHPHTNSVDWKDVEVVDGGNVLTLSQADPTGTCDTTPDPSCIMSRVAYAWNGSAYQAFDGQTPGMEGTLNTFEGFWVKAYVNGIYLRIPKTVTTTTASPTVSQTTTTTTTTSTSSTTTSSPSSTGPLSAQTTVSSSSGSGSDATAPGNVSGGKSSANTPITGENWYVRLIVKSGKLEDAGNVLGQLPDSVDGLDRHDLKEMDPFGNTYLSVVFPHRDWPTAPGLYTSDFHAPTRQPSGVWNFAVRASNLSHDVTLSWEGPATVLRRTRLIDALTGRQIRLVQGKSYTFSMASGFRYFQLIVGQGSKRESQRN